jgi:hypothetical protein
MTNATLQVPNDVIDPIIRAEVTKAIIAAMGNQGAILTQAIASILNTKVDSDGKPSNYSSNNEKTWMDWAVGNAIRSAAKEAITEIMTQQKEGIKNEMVRQLQTKNSPLVRQFVEGIISAASHPDVLKYRISIAYDEKNR